jgi:hypothetical protein
MIGWVPKVGAHHLTCIFYVASIRSLLFQLSTTMLRLDLRVMFSLVKFREMVKFLFLFFQIGEIFVFLRFL